MKSYCYFGLTILLFCCSAIIQTLSAQNVLRGKVTDEAGEPLPGANIVMPQLQTGAQTNDDGYYAIPKIPDGTHQVRVMFTDLDTIVENIAFSGGRVIVKDFVLKERGITLGTVEIIDQKPGEIDRKRANPGLNKISSQDIKVIPSLGTPDLSQYLQVLPGVVFTGDQGGQLFIRGGTPIQNMVFLDGAIIYNPFHTLGLFSIFDTDIIRSADVYSGGFSGEYGGRVSSIMDIKTRNGSFKDFGAKAHANPITAGIMLEGPLFKKKGTSESIASYIVSARQCYLNSTSSSLYSYVNEEKKLPYSFTDLYGKLTIGSGSNQVNVFGFYQQDEVAFQYPSNYRWSSGGGGANFSFLPPNSSVIISGNVAVSNYTTEQVNKDERYPRRSSIGGFNSRFNFAYIFNTVDELSYGMQLLGFNTDLRFSNSLGLITEQQNFNTEFAAYAKYRKVFREKKIVMEGQPEYFERLVLEPSIRFHYYNDQAYLSPEPRLRAKLNFKRVSFQLATGIFSQNLMSSNSDRDVVALFQGYLSAPDNLAYKKHDHPLQTAWHVLGGVQLELIENLEFNLEGWYKNFTQVTNINRDRTFPEDPIFIAETGIAHGVDLMLKYTTKKLYLYATYGWAKVTRTDQKQTYFPIFDRRHNVNFVGAYKIGNVLNEAGNKVLAPRFEFSTRWTLGTGFPFTQTQGLFEKVDFYQNGSQSNIATQNGTLGVLLASDYNGGRLPSYHRLDISIKYNILIGSKGILEINANAINVYSRENIFYFDRIRYKRVNQLPIVPTLGVAFSF